MGTRYEDQPPEHWAGPESLDPTPVWRQFLVFGVLAFGALAIIAVVSYLALAPMFVTPPALVPGGRLVLALSDVASAPDGARRVGPPLLADGEGIWVARLCEGQVLCEEPEYVGLSASWTDPRTGRTCPVVSGAFPGNPPDPIVLPQGARPSPPPAPVWFAGVDCGSATFGERGEPVNAPRGLDRYLVSVEGDRVIVNLSREIRGFGATPQPLVSPLGTPVQTRRP